MHRIIQPGGELRDSPIQGSQTKLTGCGPFYAASATLYRRERHCAEGQGTEYHFDMLMGPGEALQEEVMSLSGLPRPSQEATQCSLSAIVELGWPS